MLLAPLAACPVEWHRIERAGAAKAPWVREMIAAYDAKAKATKARIVCFW
jgi:hypothetical protein